MSFIVINIILLIVIGVLLIILSWVWPPDSPWAPWWRTNKKTARAMCKLAKINSKDIIYDLGSGDGTALLTANKEFGAKGIGIEIDILRFWIAKIRAWWGNNHDIEFRKDNFFNQNISKSSVVFVYLVPKALEKLKPKFIKELKNGTLIVSYRYKVSLPLVKEDKKHKIYLYKIP